MTELAKFEVRPEEEMVNSIAQSLPRGRLFDAANIKDSNLRRLLKGLSLEILRIEEKFSKDIYEQYFIWEGKDGFLEEWEKEVGIPNGCLTIDGKTRSERISQVITKIYMSSAVKEQDYIDLANILGIEIRIQRLSEVLYPPYDVPFFPVSEPEARFVMIIWGDNIAGGYPPYDVPFFPQKTLSEIACVFNKIKPANVKYLYLNN